MKFIWRVESQMPKFLNIVGVIEAEDIDISVFKQWKKQWSVHVSVI